MKMIQYFPEPCEQSGGNAKVGLDLFNYTMTANLDGATSIGTFRLMSKTDLASLKTKVDKLRLFQVFKAS